MTTFLAITSCSESPEGSTTTATKSSDAAEKALTDSSLLWELGTRADAAWTACGSYSLGCSARSYDSRALSHVSRERRPRPVGLQSIWPVLVVCKQLFRLHLQCLGLGEFDALLQEFKMDYNQTHFVRNREYKEAASQIQ
ncbi:hypothetical protein R1flu_022285 [Riccia fluitans]|uniref:Uncharacterized protein n=1 Tax=Riccia fluitans TaxID=41844 RepID=A0ABD1ZSK3_9MARC